VSDAKVKLTGAQEKLLAWMADGDRALHKCHYNELAYGTYGRGAKFTRMASRKTVEAMIRAGVLHWMKDSPPDLRAMRVLP
jgi:hypothetical protein